MPAPWHGSRSASTQPDNAAPAKDDTRGLPLVRSGDGMATLIVLFERSPALEQVGAALAAAGSEWAPTGTQSGEARAGGLTAEIELRAGPVTGPGIVEAAALGQWGGADAAISRHGAHARVTLVAVDRVTHGVAEDAGDEPIARMMALSQVAASLLALPGALAFFDDDGRVINDARDAARRLAVKRGAPPLDLWINLRSFELADARGWFLDTLGMAQLGLPDLEAYAGDGAASAQVSAWLRNVSLYLVQEEAGARLRHGDTLDGPDEQPWVTTEDTSTVEPRRPVLRFAPLPRDQ